MTSLSSLKNINNDLLEQCYVNKLGTFTQNNFTAGYSLRLLKGDYTGPMVNVRKDNPTHPVIALTSNTSNPDYIASASSNNSSAYLVFDNSTSGRWNSAGGYSGTTYVGSVTTLINGVAVAGEWVQLEFVNGISNITSIYYQGTGLQANFGNINICVSNDNVNFTSILTPGGYIEGNYTISRVSNTYRYVRTVCITKFQGGNDFCTIHNSTITNGSYADFYGDIQGNLGTAPFGNGQSLVSWLNGSTAFVNTLYDQSGYNRHLTQTANANQPTLTTTGNIVYNGSTTFLQNTTPPLTTGIQRYTAVCNFTATASNGNVFDISPSSNTTNQRVALMSLSNTLYFPGQFNDSAIVPYPNNIPAKTVLSINSTLSSNNITFYYNGTVYQCSSQAPTSLNPTPVNFNIGRRSSDGLEYFTGNINEVLIFNCNLTANEALTYYSPSLITRKNHRSKPKLQIKGITRTPIPIPGGLGFNGTNQIIVDSNMLTTQTSGNAISTWGQATAFNNPVYTGLSGYSNSITQPGFVSVVSASSQYLNFGSKTFNMASNGGFTAVCYMKWNSLVGNARVFDFNNGTDVDTIKVGTGSDGSGYMTMNNAGTPYVSSFSAGFFTTGWNLYAFRYTYSNNLVEFIKNGIVISSNTITGANITNKTWTNTYLGRSPYGGDPYSNWSMAGFYAVDTTLSDTQLSAVANHLTFSSTRDIPQTLPDYSRVKHTGSVLTYNGRTDPGLFSNRNINSFIDIQDTPGLPLSFSFWFNNNTTNYDQTIVALCDATRSGTGGLFGIQCDINSATNFQIFCALPTTWTSQSYTIATNTWYHVAVCVGLSNNVIIYFNGSPTTLTGTTIIQKNSRILIGADGTSVRGSSSLISDFRLFDYILRSDEVEALRGDTENSTNLSIASKENYLVNYYNWYNVMIQQKTNENTYPTYNMVQTGGADPNVALNMGTNTQQSTNCIYNITPIQNYSSFTCSFEIYSGTGSGNCFYFFVGGTAIPARNATLDCDVVANGYIIQFEEYQGNTSKGINIIDNTPVVKVNYPSTIWINSGNYYPVTISYTRGVIGTWVINFNDTEVITYSDPNNVSWVAQAGSYWGIGASNQGANSFKNIRRLELSYVPFVSSLGNTISPQTLSKYPSAPMTQNTTTLSDGTYIASASNSGGGTQPFAVFTNTFADYWGELGDGVYWSTSGAYLLSVTTTVSGTAYLGEWIQLQLPNAITLYSYTLAGRQDQFLYAYRTPFTFVIAGSNNGITWTLVDYIDGTKYASQNDGNCNNFICTAGNTNSYTYFRMIIIRISNNSNASIASAMLNISEWSLFAQNSGNSIINRQTKIPTIAMNANNPITFQPVTPFNWYTRGTVSTNGWTPIYSGSDPFGQLQLTDGSTSNFTDISYGNQPVQNFPFTFTFQIFGTNNTNGDFLRVQFGNGGSATGVRFDFEIWAYQGIRFYDSSNVLRVSSATNWYTSTWNEIRVVYTATAVNTWTMFFNGTQIIQYSDANFWNLIMNGGSTWGFYTYNGAAKFTSYIRQLNMDFNLSNNVPGIIQSSNQSLAGNYTITASNTRTDRDFFPYYVANNNAITVDRWGFPAYNISTGAYTGVVSTTVSSVTQSGEWIQYQLPTSIIVSSFTLLPEWGVGNNNYMPRSFCLAGSVDGSTWVNLYDNTNVSWVYSVEQKFTVNNNGNKYSYYRLIVRSTGLNSGNFNSDWVFISRFDLFTPSGTALSNAIGSVVVPPTTMTSYTVTVVGHQNNLLNGTYTASASSHFNDHYPWRAFQGYTDPYTPPWASSSPSYTAGTNLYTGEVSTTVNNITYLGEWLQLQVPNPVNVSSFVIAPQNPTYINRTPTRFVLAGSNNGSTWSALHIQSANTVFPTNVSWTTYTPQKFNCNQNNLTLFTYFRLIVLGVQSGTQFVAIQTLLLNTTPPPPKGLLDGLTWKFYHGNLTSVSSYSSNPYINIGRCVDTTNYRTILNGNYTGTRNPNNYSGSWNNPQNCSIEIFGYFLATVSGTWSFFLVGDNTSYFWLGANALVGFTTGNANITAAFGTSGAISFTITLIAGVYYPIRIQSNQSFGGVSTQFSFQPPTGGITSNGQGYFFSGTGSDAAFPQESAKIIKDLTNTNTDGIYYILVNGVSTPTYCLMNDIYDGGGWMMLMKMSTNTQAFTYDSSYWKYINTLNASDLTRNTGDAKYNVFNYIPVKDILGIWPDISPTSYTNIYGNNGGSFFTQDGWTWLLNNWSSGSKVTGLSGFNTSRPAGIYAENVLQPVNINNPFYYNGYGNCFSNETGSALHYINAVSGTITGGTGVSPGSTSCSVNMRWGMLYNNETTELNTNDAGQGIGFAYISYNVYASAADWYSCCGTAGINRTARFELFGR